MTVRDLWRHWRADLYRHRGSLRPHVVLGLLCTEPGALYMLHWRWARFLYEARPRLLWTPLRWCQNVVLRHYSVKFGIGLPVHAEVGRGLRFSHHGTIVVNSGARVGDDCVICQGVTLGKLTRGSRAGAPTIGNSVFLAPGAKVLGRVTVGNNVVVGANSVVTTDLPDGAVAGGIPAVILSDKGADGYATHTDYAWD